MSELGSTAWQYWKETAPSAANSDGPLPYMDMLVIGGLVVVGGAFVIDGIINLYNAISKPEEETQDIVQDVTKTSKREVAIFEANPYMFKPKGLLMQEYPGSRNGRIIKWFNESVTMIFEWDEDHTNGSHYHIMIHDATHYYPGDIVPEPYNTIYFGW